MGDIDAPPDEDPPKKAQGTGPRYSEDIPAAMNHIINLLKISLLSLFFRQRTFILEDSVR